MPKKLLLLAAGFVAGLVACGMLALREWNKLTVQQHAASLAVAMPVYRALNKDDISGARKLLEARINVDVLTLSNYSARGYDYATRALTQATAQLKIHSQEATNALNNSEAQPQQ